MTIAALITEGIGPGGAVKYIMTGGLSLKSVPAIVTDTHDGIAQRPKFKGWEEDARQRREEAAVLRRQIEDAVDPPAPVVAKVPKVTARESTGKKLRAPERPALPQIKIDLAPLTAKLGDFLDARAVEARKRAAAEGEQAVHAKAEAERLRLIAEHNDAVIQALMVADEIYDENEALIMHLLAA